MQLAIFGPGLIGGSIALATLERAVCSRVTVWSRDEAERAMAQRLIFPDLVTDDLGVAARGADLAILCTPPAAMPELARALLPHLKADAVLSDVASVKSRIAGELARVAGERYVGAHPMAGSDATGLAAAQSDLFLDCVCLVTPHPVRLPRRCNASRISGSNSAPAYDECRPRNTMTPLR